MNLNSRTYYELLGISRNASVEEIKAVYKEIARVYHPDSNFYDEILPEDLTNDPGMEIFKLITAAYNTLIHEERRKNYDQTLPPELPNWEPGDQDLTSRTNWDNPEHGADRYTGRVRKPTGTFGRGTLREFGGSTKSSFDDIEFGKNVQPVSAMFFRTGFIWKFRRWLGL